MFAGDVVSKIRPEEQIFTVEIFLGTFLVGIFYVDCGKKIAKIRTDNT